MTEQNFANHVKLVPAFHFFVLPVLVLNFGWAVYRLAHYGYTGDGLINLLTSVAFVLLALNARMFALCVQDRVIRVEERQRLGNLLPDDLKSRIGEFTPKQLVGLRFASDAELPGLARKVLTDKVTDVKAIKQMVQHWRADYLRA